MSVDFVVKKLTGLIKTNRFLKLTKKKKTNRFTFIGKSWKWNSKSCCSSISEPDINISLGRIKRATSGSILSSNTDPNMDLFETRTNYPNTDLCFQCKLPQRRLVWRVILQNSSREKNFSTQLLSGSMPEGLLSYLKVKLAVDKIKFLPLIIKQAVEGVLVSPQDISAEVAEDFFINESCVFKFSLWTTT